MHKANRYVVRIYNNFLLALFSHHQGVTAMSAVSEQKKRKPYITLTSENGKKKWQNREQQHVINSSIDQQTYTTGFKTAECQLLQWNVRLISRRISFFTNA